MSAGRYVKYLWGFAVLLLLGGCQPTGSTRMEPIFVGLVAVTATPSASPTPPFTPTPAATPTATPEPPPFDFSQTDNLLLLGTDRRPDWTNWRTDSMMIIGIDHQYKRAVVFSIPRDLYVSIPGYGQARINQVDYLGEKTLKAEGGGPALVSQVLRETLGISTNHWVRVEMRGFSQMVDALGGVTVNLDCPFYELIYDLDDEAWTYFELPAGNVLMDGQTAYHFVTLRYIESDFGRSQRQRQFLWALRNQARDTNLILRLPELWTAFQQTFFTDLSLLEMIQLARFGLSIEPENVRSAALTNTELERYITAGGADVLRIGDLSKVQAVLDNVWSGTSLADTGRSDPAACRPKPQGVPSYVIQQIGPVGPVPEPTIAINQETAGAGEPEAAAVRGGGEPGEVASEPTESTTP